MIIYLYFNSKYSENYKEIVNSISHRMKDRYSISLDSKKIINRIEQYPTEINHANIYSFIMHDLFNYSNKRLCILYYYFY